jgi:micrococcal nuclease
MYGIDTPESRTRDLIEKKYGIFAKEFVEAHLPLNSITTLRTKKDKVGKFGRVLGEFVLREPTSDLTGLIKIETLNQLMIHFKIGVAYHGQAKELIEHEHRKNRDLVDLTCLDNMNWPVKKDDTFI